MRSNYSNIALIVCIYWFMSCGTVLMNKFLLSSNTDLGKVDSPFFITWLQCFVCVIICAFLGHINHHLPYWINIEKPSISLHTAWKVLPVSCFFVGMIGANNICLKHVSVPFISLSRVLTILFNVLFSWTLLDKPISSGALQSCIIMSLSFLMGAREEYISGSLSTIGLTFALIASLFSSLFFVFTKRTLNTVNNNIWSLTWYNNVNACVLFLPLMLISGDLHKVLHSYQVTKISFWIYQLTGGFFAFGVGFATALQIAKTSPLTHTISGAAKGVILAVIGVIVYQEEKSYVWWLSFCTFGISCGFYVYFKSMEMKEVSTHKNHLHKMLFTN